MQHMGSISQLLWGAHVSSTSSPGVIEQYITETHIDCVGTWGTDVEMFALAHLLDTAILSYVLSRNRWVKFSQCNVDYTLADCDQAMAMYIYHAVSHFEVVTSIE